MLVEHKVDTLKDTLDTHMTDCHQKFSTIHSKLIAVDERADQLIKSQQSLTDSQRETNTTLKELSQDAKGVIKVFNDVQGAARVGTFITKAFKYAVGLPVVAIGALEIIKVIAATFNGS